MEEQDKINTETDKPGEAIETDGGGAPERPADVADSPGGKAAQDGKERAPEGPAEETDKPDKNPAEETVESAPPDAKKSFKKKVKTDKQKERINELEDRVIRQMAEFENFRKRSEKEKAQMFEIGARSIIEKILPVVDSLERGLAAIPETEKGSSFAEGLDRIYKQLNTELESLDVKVIPTVGHEFNPDLHNAVMQVESAEFASGIVAQEMQKGYTYRDSVVRHSMVSVVE